MATSTNRLIAAVQCCSLSLPDQRQRQFATLDRLPQRLGANKSELLLVLDRPEIPLHTSGSENRIRRRVTRRHLGSRLDLQACPNVPYLPDLVRCRGAPA
ncbi:MAG: hypothetical protein ACREFO_13870 [Acetobacteraceae bacterium]